MTGEQNTGNPARIPMAERARRGWLAGEPVLTLEDILALEFPGADYKTTKPWRRMMESAIEFGQLPARRFNPFPYEPGDVVFILGCSTWLIDRDGYRRWRSNQADPPQNSYIHLWLGAPALPQGEPDRPEPGAVATRQIALVDAEDAALAALRHELRREPNFEEFWCYIIKRDDTGTIADYTDDRLMWTGKDGRNCETAKSTLRNRLKMAKSRNPLKT